MNSTIFTLIGILSDFKGLNYKQIGPVCDRYDDFMVIEYRKTKSYDHIWTACHNDQKCKKLEEDVEHLLEVCGD